MIWKEYSNETTQISFDSFNLLKHFANVYKAENKDYYFYCKFSHFSSFQQPKHIYFVSDLI